MAFALLVPGGLSDGEPDWVAWLGAHGGDKIIHLILFFGQAFWLSRLFERHDSSQKAAGLAALIAALYGCLLEWAQIAVPGRGFELMDLAANTAGAFLWPLVRNLLPRR